MRWARAQFLLSLLRPSLTFVATSLYVVVWSLLILVEGQSGGRCPCGGGEPL